MKQDTNNQEDGKKKTLEDKTDQWIDKAEAFIDEAAEKFHQSDTYQKAGKSLENITKKVFRKAGKWWGKTDT